MAVVGDIAYGSLFLVCAWVANLSYHGCCSFSLEWRTGNLLSLAANQHSGFTVEMIQGHPVLLLVELSCS